MNKSDPVSNSEFYWGACFEWSVYVVKVKLLDVAIYWYTHWGPGKANFWWKYRLIAFGSLPNKLTLLIWFECRAKFRVEKFALITQKVEKGKREKEKKRKRKEMRWWRNNVHFHFARPRKTFGNRKIGMCLFYFEKAQDNGEKIAIL